MTSETVRAAQRLLAERERFGLAKYGTTVDRTDLQAADWLQHAIEEASDLLLYLIRLRQTLQATPVTDFNLYTSPAVQAMQPAPAAAPEDAERAAYLERWANAPEWADELCQNLSGVCRWVREYSYGRQSQYAGHNILGSVLCEPRPVQGVGE